MTTFSRTLVFAALLSGPPALAAEIDPATDAPVRVQSQNGAEGDTLEELERRADELSETARRTIEEFVNLVGPMLTRLSRLIEGLPTYETPEILPNGDIIIRRRPALPELPAPLDTPDEGLTET